MIQTTDDLAKQHAIMEGSVRGIGPTKAVLAATALLTVASVSGPEARDRGLPRHGDVVRRDARADADPSGADPLSAHAVDRRNGL